MHRLIGRFSPVNLVRLDKLRHAVHFNSVSVVFYLSVDLWSPCMSIASCIVLRRPDVFTKLLTYVVRRRCCEVVIVNSRCRNDRGARSECVVEAVAPYRIRHTDAISRTRTGSRPPWLTRQTRRLVVG